MKHYYSIKTTGFYAEDTLDGFRESGTLPDDLTEISSVDFENYFNTPDGYYAVFDEKGPRIEKIPAPDYVAIAEAERGTLLESATSAIVIWQTKLLMGRKLTSAESKSLNAWMDYIDALNAVDTSTAPDITWPAAPSA